MAERMKVECTECGFQRFMDPDDGEKPADALVEHGRQTGHKLTVQRVDD